jgi:hypothetical protein
MSQVPLSGPDDQSASIDTRIHAVLPPAPKSAAFDASKREKAQANGKRFELRFLSWVFGGGLVGGGAAALMQASRQGDLVLFASVALVAATICAVRWMRSYPDDGPVPLLAWGAVVAGWVMASIAWQDDEAPALGNNLGPLFGAVAGMVCAAGIVWPLAKPGPRGSIAGAVVLWSLVAALLGLVAYGGQFTPLGQGLRVAYLRDYQGGAGAAELVDMLADADMPLRDRIDQALLKIGPDALPACLKGLEDSDAKVRWVCAKCVSRFQLDAAAIPDLVRALDRINDTWVKGDVVRALGKLGQPAVPALCDALNHPDPQIRSQAIDALGAIGPAAKDAVPALLRVWREDKPLSAYAVYAVTRIDPQAATPAVWFLCKQLKTEPASAALALGRIGPGAWIAVSDLTTAYYEAHRQYEQARRGKVDYKTLETYRLEVDRRAETCRIIHWALRQIDAPAANRLWPQPPPPRTSPSQE